MYFYNEFKFYSILVHLILFTIKNIRTGSCFILRLPLIISKLHFQIKVFYTYIIYIYIL